MKVGIYVRVSTEKQKFDSQLHDLKRDAERRGWTIYKIYEDKMSGTKDNRPGLNQLMKDARRRKFNVLLVWRFDRFARSSKHLINVVEELSCLNINFVSYQENIDLKSPMGTAMFTILAALAQLERDITSERVKAGLRAAEKKGIILGRPPTMSQEIIKKVGELQSKGENAVETSRQLNLSVAMVGRARRVYNRRSVL